MKKVISSLVLSLLFIGMSHSMEFAVSTAEASREAHSAFINEYRSKIEGKTANQNIPFAIIAAIMSSQAGADKELAVNNFSLITSDSKYARVGKFSLAATWNGLMVFDRPRHNAEATVLVLQGWVKHQLATAPNSDIDWLHALTHPKNGLLPPERLAELAVAYEAATNTYLDLAALNLTEAKTIANGSVSSKEKVSITQIQQEFTAKGQKLETAKQVKGKLQAELINTQAERQTVEGEIDSVRQKVVHLKHLKPNPP